MPPTALKLERMKLAKNLFLAKRGLLDAEQTARIFKRRPSTRANPDGDLTDDQTIKGKSTSNSVTRGPISRVLSEEQITKQQSTDQRSDTDKITKKQLRSMKWRAEQAIKNKNRKSKNSKGTINPEAEIPHNRTLTVGTAPLVGTASDAGSSALSSVCIKTAGEQTSRIFKRRPSTRAHPDGDLMQDQAINRKRESKIITRRPSSRALAKDEQSNGKLQSDIVALRPSSSVFSEEEQSTSHSDAQQSTDKRSDTEKITKKQLRAIRWRAEREIRKSNNSKGTINPEAEIPHNVRLTAGTAPIVGTASDAGSRASSSDLLKTAGEQAPRIFKRRPSTRAHPDGNLMQDQAINRKRDSNIITCRPSSRALAKDEQSTNYSGLPSTCAYPDEDSKHNQAAINGKLQSDTVAEEEQSTNHFDLPSTCAYPAEDSKHDQAAINGKLPSDTTARRPSPTSLSEVERSTNHFDFPSTCAYPDEDSKRAINGKLQSDTVALRPSPCVLSEEEQSTNHFEDSKHDQPANNGNSPSKIVARRPSPNSLSEVEQITSQTDGQQFLNLSSVLSEEEQSTDHFEDSKHDQPANNGNSPSKIVALRPSPNSLSEVEQITSQTDGQQGSSNRGPQRNQLFLKTIERAL